MASGPPSPHAHVAGHDEAKEKSISGSSGDQETTRTPNLDPVTGKPVQDLAGDKIELTEEDCYDELGFCFPEWKKWFVTSLKRRQKQDCSAGDIWSDTSVAGL